MKHVTRERRVETKTTKQSFLVSRQDCFGRYDTSFANDVSTLPRNDYSCVWH